MKKRITSIIPATLGACTLMTASTAFQANAHETTLGGFYLVPSAGYHMTEKLDHYKKIEERDHKHPEEFKVKNLKFDFDDGFDVGIAFGYQKTGHTAFEFAYNYGQFDITDSSIDINTNTKYKGKGQTSFHYLHADYLYFFDNIYENNFSLYVPVGIGYTKNDPKYTDGPIRGIEDTKVNAGLGAYYRISDHFGIRGDVRGLYGLSQRNFDAIVQVGLTFRLNPPPPVDTGPTIQSATLHFKLDSTKLVNRDNPDLVILAETLRNQPNAQLKILAYSDRSGNSDYNMRLSERRAESLKSIFVNQYGIDSHRIETKALGDESGRSRDRHAVAVVEY